jgi:anaerobic ribonucleoside-triphosphate reductase
MSDQLINLVNAVENEIKPHLSNFHSEKQRIEMRSNLLALEKMTREIRRNLLQESKMIKNERKTNKMPNKKANKNVNEQRSE